MNNDLVGIESGLMWDRFAWVFRRAGKLEGLGAMEGGREADFAGFLGVDLAARYLSVPMILSMRGDHIEVLLGRVADLLRGTI